MLYILFRKCAARIVCPHMHTLRLFIYTSTWVFTLSVFCEAVEGLEVEQAEVKHPRFFYVVIY